jgi:hypothetical protein
VPYHAPTSAASSAAKPAAKRTAQPRRSTTAQYDWLFPFSPTKPPVELDRSLWDVISRKVPGGYTIPDRDVMRELAKWSRGKG